MRCSDRPRPQSVTNLEFLLLAMRAIGTRHSITNHFTAQLELDMNAAGINDSVAECPVSFDNYSKFSVPNRFGEFNAYPSSSRPSMTEVLEDLNNSNIAAGFHKKDQTLLSIAGGQPKIVPYFIHEMNRREKESSSEQNTRIGSAQEGTSLQQIGPTNKPFRSRRTTSLATRHLAIHQVQKCKATRTQRHQSQT
jgi:hypothetical protein